MAANKKLKIDNEQKSIKDIDSVSVIEIDSEVVPCTGRSVSVAAKKKFKLDYEHQSIKDIESAAVKEIDSEIAPCTGPSVLPTQSSLLDFGFTPTCKMPEKFMDSASTSSIEDMQLSSNESSQRTPEKYISKWQGTPPCAETPASMSTPNKSDGSSLNSPIKADSLKMKNLIDGLNEGFSDVETGLKVSLYHVSKAETKEAENNPERVKRLNRILMGKFQLLTQLEQMISASLNQRVHSLKQREITLLKDLSNKQDQIEKLERQNDAQKDDLLNKQDQIEKLERQNDAQKEQLYKVERQLLLETARHIDLSDDFEESDGSNKSSAQITDTSSCAAAISKADILPADKQDSCCGDKDDLSHDILLSRL